MAALRRYDLLDTAPEASFDRITALVKAVLNVPIALVSLIDENRQWFKSCIGLSGTETSRDISFCKYTIKSREPMYVPDTLLDPRFAENPLVTGEPYIRSYLGVPLSTPDGYNLGSLCAIDTQPRKYDAGQIEVLKSFAALVTDEMELRRIAAADELTGAMTRRGFSLEMDKAIARMSRSQRPSTLVMFDIDHFKRINDTYGHPTGDAVLRQVSERISSLLRKNDVLGRLGGEEFGILLPDLTLEEGEHAAERFREALAFSEIGTDPPLRVTASFGIAAVSPGITSKHWLADADEALYAAKRSGRNRCCVAQPVEAQLTALAS